MSTNSREAAMLTKADTVALWHAVQNSALMLRESRELLTEELFQQERARVLAAKRALRKVNALRRAAASIREAGKE